jgi:hypothetical protein
MRDFLSLLLLFFFLFAAVHGEAAALVGGDLVSGDGLLGVVECGWHELVVGPAAFLAHGHEAGVAEGLEMEGEQGLADVAVGLEIAHALLAAAKEVEDAEATGVGQGVEERRVTGEALAVGGLRRRGGLAGGCGGHISTYQDALIYARPLALGVRCEV